MLTTTELTQARADVLETLVSDVVIRRLSTGLNDVGYPTETWATASTVKGRIDNLARSSAADMIAMQEKGRVFYQLTVTWDADIVDNDRVQVGGIDYEVKSINVAQDLRIVKRGIVVRAGS